MDVEHMETLLSLQFFHESKTILKLKAYYEPTDWENIFKIHKPGKGLVPRKGRTLTNEC